MNNNRFIQKVNTRLLLRRVCDCRKYKRISFFRMETFVWSV